MSKGVENSIESYRDDRKKEDKDKTTYGLRKKKKKETPRYFLIVGRSIKTTTTVECIKKLQ